MKAHIKNLFLVFALTAGLGLPAAVRAPAQTFTVLHTFTNSDGNWPQGSLVLSSNTLYGTTLFGGISGLGTVFAVNTDGTGFTNLHDFTAVVNSANSDGGFPKNVLALSGNTLYGTTSAWGPLTFGTVYAVNTDGTGFTNLHSFTGGTDGAFPLTGLTLSGSNLYGSTFQFGANYSGTIFAIDTNGTSFTTLN